jgi:hypothetical protein
VLYQLSHASALRFFSRDFCVVNSSNVKIPAFNEACDANPDYSAKVELAMQSDRLTPGWNLQCVS